MFQHKNGNMRNEIACKFVNPTWKMISKTMNAKASSNLLITRGAY